MADGTITIDIIMDDGSVKKGLASINGLEGATNKAGISIKSMVAAMGLVKIASAAFDVLKSSVGDAVSRFDTMQKFPKVMQSLGFSAEESNKSMQKLSGGIKDLPTKLDDVVSQTQQLTSITGDLDKSTDTVLALNNAFLASGSSSEDASRGMIQYNQMLAKGTVDMQSWHSLQETMPLALQKTAEAMGFTGKTAQQDLYAALQNGKVTFDQFNDQLIKLGTGTGQLAKLAKTNSIGISTSFTNLKTAVSRGLSGTIQAFNDLVVALTGKGIAENISSLGGIIDKAFSGINSSIGGIIPLVENLKKSFDFSGLQQSFSQYGTALLSSFSAVFSKIGPLIGKVLGQIPALFQTLVSAVAPIITQISSMISKLDFSGIQAVIQAIIPAVVSGFQTMMAIVGPSIQQVITSFGNLWNAIQPLLTVLAGALMPAFQVIGSFLGGVFKGILDGVSFAFDAIKVVVEILTPVISFLVDVFKACAPALSTVGQWVGYVIGMFSSLGGSGGSLKSILSSAWDGIKSAISVAGNVIGAVINVIKAVFSAVGAAGGGLKGVLSAAWSGIQSAISVAGGVISGIINTIKGVFSALSGAGNSLKSGISSAWSAITGAISKASGTIGGIIDNIKGFFTGLTNIDISGAGTAIMNGFLGGLKGAYENVKDFIGGIGSWIKEHKGPISYDRKLLIPAGNSIMNGLNEGLGDSFKNVQRNVSGMADKLASGFNLNLPKVTAEYAVSSAGLNAGEQLAVSQLNSIRSNIQRQLDNQPNQSESNNIVSQALSAVKSLGEHETVLVINDKELARTTAKANQDAQNNLTKIQTILWGGTS